MDALRDKNVLITGAAGGIGRALAEVAIEAGAKVMLKKLGSLCSALCATSRRSKRASAATTAPSAPCAAEYSAGRRYD